MSEPAIWQVFVNEARLEVAPGEDPRRPGAAITDELCGSWDHEGPCRWPHHTSVAVDGDGVLVVRTVFAAPPPDADGLTVRINRALSDDPGWRLVRWGRADATDDERSMGQRWANQRL